jgi:hypothetical protein
VRICATHRAVHAAADEALVSDLCQACDRLCVPVEPHGGGVVTRGLRQVPAALAQTQTQTCGGEVRYL